MSVLTYFVVAALPPTKTLVVISTPELGGENSMLAKHPPVSTAIPATSDDTRGPVSDTIQGQTVSYETYLLLSLLLLDGFI